jgi:DNA-binding SARP family transcriptional activator
LRGDIGWVREILDEYTPGQQCYWPEVEILMALESGRLSTLASQLPQEEEGDIWLRTVLEFLVADTEPQASEVALSVRNLLRKPLLQIEHLLSLHAVASLLSALPIERRALLRDNDTDLEQALNRALEWLAERSIAAYMLPIIERYGTCLPRKEVSQWRSRAKEIAIKRDRMYSSGGRNDRLNITMIGTITIAREQQEPQTLRGARVRTVLGLLVGARMLPEPLSNNEFCHLAAGGEIDIDLARKTANMGIVRLREAIGADAVLTGEETYELNLQRVRVDLLEAYDLIGRARESFRRKALMQAYQYLLRVLDLAGGEVLFPGLYDDFFEALRSDFEFMIRSLVVDLSRVMLHEGDIEVAGRLLQRCFAMMPEDEGIAELLQRAFSINGRQTDVERVRMKTMVME